MTRAVKRSGRLTGARNPKAYALSIAGAVLVLLGLVVVDSVLLVATGAALAVAGWLVARRYG
ncbi:hypothetical protein V6V47_20250 [Micromonospora sp. CPCC 205539]|uniref:hypothetical protein n=1 Tax=Micromonospora sp. CPCC 205539 TaxID=3122408 RepID=UPI002FF00A6D